MPLSPFAPVRTVAGNSPRALPLMSFLIALALLLLPVPAAQGAWVDHLQAIGFDKVMADERFSGLSGGGFTIAVFDSGIDPTHVMFADRDISGVNFAPDMASLASTGIPYRDGHGHGTLVTSVAAGNLAVTQDGEYLGGIAFGADIAAVRVLDNTGRGSFSDIIAGLDWVIEQVLVHDRDIRVVNMSLGTRDAFATAPPTPTARLLGQRVERLAALGIPVVASSGNAGSPDGLSFPAIHPKVISVGSIDAHDALSWFTNHGEALALLAPGEDVPGAAAALNAGDPNDEAVLASGTSLSAPLVAGSILLIQEVAEVRWGRAATVDELLHILTTTASPVVHGEMVYPRLDLYRALEYTWVVPEPASLMLLLAAAAVVMSRRVRQ